MSSSISKITLLIAFFAFQPFVYAGGSKGKGPARPSQAQQVPSVPARAYFTYPGIDCNPSVDLSYLSLPFVSCASQCDGTPTCTGFVEDISTGFNCWLKSNPSSLIINSQRSTLLVAQPARDYTTQLSTTYSGSDIVYYTGPYTSCAAACDAIGSICVGYVEDHDNSKTSNCWLKSSMTVSGLSSSNTRNSVILTSRIQEVKPFLIYLQTGLSADSTYRDVFFSICPYLCSADPECVAYTTNTNNNRGCWFRKIATGATINTSQDTYIQPLSQARQYNPSPNTNFAQVSISVYYGTIGGCAIACDNAIGCVGYSVSTNNALMCTLKSSLSSFSYDTTSTTYTVSTFTSNA